MNKWLFILSTSLILLFLTNGASAIVVNNNTKTAFTTIQQAIDDPTTTNGHQIIVTGTYQENIQINKNITLKAQGTATIKAKNQSIETVTINPAGSGTTINGFTITNGYTGIKIQAKQCKITNNNITNNKYSSLYLGGLGFVSLPPPLSGFLPYSPETSNNMISGNNIKTPPMESFSPLTTY